MKTTKTSEAIAKRMRKRGYTTHRLVWLPDKTWWVKVEGAFLQAGRCVKYERYYVAIAKTITAAYREIERQWEEEQSDG